MFERDKDVLREAGIPVELVPTDPFEVEEGYTIPKERYYLPDIDFTPDPAGDTAAVLRSEGMKFIVPLDCKQTIADNFVRFLSAAEGWHHTSSSEDRHSRKARTRDLVELLDSVSAA